MRRCAGDAIKAHPVKMDRSDARALAEMLRTGWFLQTGEVKIAGTGAALRPMTRYARPISDSDPSQHSVRHLLVVKLHYNAIFDEK